ncbi:protein phosphatase 2C-like protein [Novymonas esmeraldas]|uniref:Protein phosphatase 2C-like protein n=1 Tax=Novymonas esmeraldas TaxID=1808958 RepID=A0AAW0FBJ9_9TRYP
MIRKGRRGVNAPAPVAGGVGGAPARSASREVSSHTPPTAVSPTVNRTSLLYQCYDASVYAPTNGTCTSPSKAVGAGGGGGAKKRTSGMHGAYAAGPAASKANRTKRDTGIAGIAGFMGTSRQGGSQASTPLRNAKAPPPPLANNGNGGARTPPPPPPPPLPSPSPSPQQPVARAGESYANENARLVVSDPLPYSARQRKRDGSSGVGAAKGRDERRGSPARNGVAADGGTGGPTRPRASSLPRTPEDLSELLPRLRPLRDGADLGELRSPPPLSTDARHYSSGGVMCTSEAAGERPREALSASLASSSIIPSSYSPRPVADQLRLRGRHTSNRGGGGDGGDGAAAAARAAGRADARAPQQQQQQQQPTPPAPGSSSSDSDDAGPAAAGVPFELEAGSAGSRPVASETQRKVKGGAGAAVAAAVAQRGVAGLRGASSEPEYGQHVGPSSAAAVDSDKLFGCTQLLSSLRPDVDRDGGARPTPPPVPATAPSSRLRHRAGSGPGGAETELPPYKFNVVLSSGKTATAPISLLAGSGCVQGMRPTMEDAHFVELNAAEVRGQPVSLLAVLDGHCGRRVADLGAKWLPHYILHHAALGENNALALVESILQTDREIFHTLQTKKTQQQQQQRKMGRGSGRRRRDVEEDVFDEAAGDANGGSTLIAATVYGRMLYVACLGDARAVLYDGHTTIAMSEDHKPGNTDESRRIAKCGGFVQFGRVCGILAVSRALGDFEFKFQPSSSVDAKGEERLSTDFPFAATGSVASSSSHNRRFISNRDLMVSNIADVRQLHLTDASAFLLLACDGLWDVLSNEEATEFVRDFLCYTPDVCDPHILSGVKPRPSPDAVRRVLNNCCQKLAEFAVDRGSMDNVSVMVLFFHDVVDTVARFSGRQPTAVTAGAGDAANSQSQSLRGSGGGGSHPRNSAPSAFELTNNQLKVRNGRVVAQR